MGKLDVKTQKNGNAIQLNMSGTIDEDADFTQIQLADAQEINLDLGGIKSINSCGIREWIKWMATNKTAKINFNQCPKVIVDQINMVDGFLPSNGKVLSFFVPYYNDDSGAEKNILFRYGTEFSEGNVNPPKEIKDEAGNDMEMDVIETKYFKFIKK